jgi:hypothetical protein
MDGVKVVAPEGFRELSDAELSDILSSQPKKSQVRESKYATEGKTGKKSKVRFSFDDRTFDGWFNLESHFNECTIEGHDETHSRSSLCAELPDGRWTCRRCFLTELDKK